MLKSGDEQVGDPLVNAVSDGAAVVSIGDVEYASFDEAWANVKSGDTIKFLAGTTIHGSGSGQYSLDSRKVTLDLNGQTVTEGNDGNTLFKIGDLSSKLTIKDSSADRNGKLSLMALGGYDFDIYQGSLVIESGTIEGTGPLQIVQGEGCEFIMSGGTLRGDNTPVQLIGSVATIVCGTVISKNNGAEGTYSCINATGSKIKVLSEGENPGAQEVQFLGGRYSINAQGEGNEIYINGGHYQKPIYVSKVKKVSVYDGFFEGGIEGDATHFINGGYFGSEVSDGHLAEGMEAEASTAFEGYPYQVCEPDVASIGDTLYKSFDEAWDAAQNNNTIKLLKNTTTSCQHKADNRGLTLDLNGKQLTATGTDAARFVSNGMGASIIIEDTSAEKTGAIVAAETCQSLLTTLAGGTIRVRGGTLDGGASPAIVMDNGYLYVSGGTLKSNGTVLALSGEVTVSVTTGFFNGTISSTITKFLGGGYYDVTPSQKFLKEGLETAVSGREDYPFTVIEKDSEASIGSVFYKTFGDAWAAAKDNDTIKIRMDITIHEGGGTYEANNKAITIDLNGKTVTEGNSNNVLFSASGEYGQIIFTDSSEAKTGHLIIKSDTYLPIQTQNGGSFLVEGGTIDYSGNKSLFSMSEGSTFAMTGGTLRGKKDIIGLSGATAIISGGHIICDASAGDNVGCVNIIGNSQVIIVDDAKTPETSTLHLEGGAYSVAASGAASKLYLQGGVFDSKVIISDIEEASVSGGFYGAGIESTVNSFITGGSFASEINGSHIAEGYFKASSGIDAYPYTVTKQEAMINDVTTYATFDEAWAAAQNGDTIKLMVPVTKSVRYTLSGKQVTLDLNGKTFTSKSLDDFTFEINGSEGTGLTVKDSTSEGTGSIISEGNYGALMGLVSGSLKVESGTLDGMSAGVVSAAGGSLQVTGGTLKAETDVILANGTADILITGGTLTLNAKAGMEAYCVQATGNGHLSIAGGKFKGTIKSEATGYISGGYFDTALKAEQLAKGYGVYKTESSDYPYSVRKQNYVASISGGARYESFEEAWNAAGNGDTIYLLQDITETKKYTLEDKILLLDLDGKTFTSTVTEDSAFSVKEDNGKAIFWILDTSKEKTGTINNLAADAAGSMISAEGGTVVISGGSLQSGARNAVQVNNGALLLTAGSISSGQKAVYVTGDSDVMVSGGTFTGTLDFDVTTGTTKEVGVEGGYFTDLITCSKDHFILAGFFKDSSKPDSSKIAEGYKLTASGITDYPYTVQECNYVASLKSTDSKEVFYESFDAAWNAAKSNDTLKLLQDVEINKTYDAISGILNLDLNGKSITAAFPVPEEPEEPTSLFRMASENAVLNVTDSSDGKNGKIQGDALTTYLIDLSDGYLYIRKGTLTGGTDSAVHMTGGYYSQFGGTIESNGKAVSASGNSKVDISDGIFKSPLDINVSGAGLSAIDISGGSFEAPVTLSTESGGSSDLCVNGGYFKSPINSTNNTGFIMSGFFKEAPSSSLITTSYKVSASGISDYPYMVALCDYKVSINDKQFFETFDEAFSAAKDGDTIKLLDNISTDTAYTLTDRSIRLDLNGQTFTGNAKKTEDEASFDCFLIQPAEGKTACLTVTDSSKNQTGTISTKGNAIHAEDGIAVLSGGIFDGNLLLNGTTVSGTTKPSGGSDGDIPTESIVTGGFYKGTISGTQTKIISGGYFKTRPDNIYIADHYFALESGRSDDYKYVVSYGEASVVSTSAGGDPVETRYGTLKEALEAARPISETETGDVVRLQKDIETSLTYEIINKKITLDLNGYTIESKDTAEGACFLINDANAVLRFIDRTVLLADDLKVNRGTLQKADGFTNPLVSVSAGSLIIEDGIYRGIIKATGAGTIKVRGGNFTKAIDVGATDPALQGFVTGGCFTEEARPYDAYLAPMYFTVPSGNAEFPYQVIHGAASVITSVGGDQLETLYAFFKDAFEAAEAAEAENPTIKILKEITLDKEYIVASKNLTIDLNGQTVHAASGKRHFTVGGEALTQTVTLSITDSSFEKKGLLSDGSPVALVAAGTSDASSGDGTGTASGTASGDGAFTVTEPEEGGAVKVLANGKLLMTAGSIKDNSAAAGGGVFVSEAGAVTLGGTAVITGNRTAVSAGSSGAAALRATDNLYLEGSDQKVSVSGEAPLEEGAQIGISLEFYPENKTGPSFTILAETSDTDYSPYFTSDNEAYGIADRTYLIEEDEEEEEEEEEPSETEEVKVFVEELTYITKHTLILGKISKLTFDKNGGTLHEETPTEYTEGAVLQLTRKIDKNGNAFVGWYKDETPVPEISTESFGDMALKATWSEIRVENITQRTSYYYLWDAILNAQNGDTIEVLKNTTEETSGTIVIDKDICICTEKKSDGVDVTCTLADGVNIRVSETAKVCLGKPSDSYSGTKKLNGIICIAAEKGEYEFTFENQMKAVLVNAGTTELNNTVISGGSKKMRGILQVSGSLQLKNSAVINGSAVLGGGIYMKNGTLTMSGSDITSNDALYGGGLFIENGTVKTESSYIHENAAEFDGGGVGISMGSFTMGINSFIYGNAATDNGGGIYISGGTINMNGGSIQKNSGALGGGVYAKGGTFNFTQGKINSNYCKTGGGIYADAPSKVNLSGDGEKQIKNNYALTQAGGLYVDDPDVVSMKGYIIIWDNVIQKDGVNTRSNLVNNKDNNARVTITGAFAEKTFIGVTNIGESENEDEWKFVTKNADQFNEDNNILKRFCADDYENYHTEFRDGEVVLVKGGKDPGVTPKSSDDDDPDNPWGAFLGAFLAASILGGLFYFFKKAWDTGNTLKKVQKLAKKIRDEFKKQKDRHDRRKREKEEKEKEKEKEKKKKEKQKDDDNSEDIKYTEDGGELVHIEKSKSKLPNKTDSYKHATIIITAKEGYETPKLNSASNCLSTVIKRENGTLWLEIGFAYSDVTVDVSVSQKAYTVNFLEEGRTSTPGERTLVHSEKVKQGEKASSYDPGTITDYRFDGWYSDPEYKKKYDFDTPVTANMNLYGRWIKDPQEVTLQVIAKDSQGTVLENGKVFKGTVTGHFDWPYTPLNYGLESLETELLQLRAGKGVLNPENVDGYKKQVLSGTTPDVSEAKEILASPNGTYSIPKKAKYVFVVYVLKQVPPTGISSDRTASVFMILFGCLAGIMASAAGIVTGFRRKLKKKRAEGGMRK